MSAYICCVNGAGGVGKDSFAAACKKISTADVYNLSMIDYVKGAARQLGWDGKKDDVGRRFLSDLKDALQDYNDGPYITLAQAIWDIVDSGGTNYMTDDRDCIIFVHARDPRDIARLVEDFDAFTVLIRRPVVEDNHTYTNHADLDVLQYHPYDYIYWNTGDMEKLEHDVKNFLEILMKFGKKLEDR